MSREAVGNDRTGRLGCVAHTPCSSLCERPASFDPDRQGPGVGRFRKPAVPDHPAIALSLDG